MIPFSIEVYIRLIERYAETFWPMSVVAFIVAAIAVFICFKPGKFGNRMLGVYLAAAWFWIGTVYYGNFFTGLNWAAWFSAGLFVVQGALLGVYHNRIEVLYLPTVAGRVGMLFMLFALIAYPALGAWAGLKFSAAPIVGLHPEPTILFTLGVLLLSSPKIYWRLIALPILAALISGVAAWMMDWPHDVLVLAAGALACVLTLRSTRR